MIKLKRVYDPPSPSDGLRVLVDRLWPRGLTKERAAVDLWLKDVAPSDSLRKWFGHEPKKWPEFQRRYRIELRRKPEGLREIKKLEAAKRTVTLLFAAKDERLNNAAALLSLLG